MILLTFHISDGMHRETIEMFYEVSTYAILHSSDDVVWEATARGGKCEL